MGERVLAGWQEHYSGDAEAPPFRVSHVPVFNSERFRGQAAAALMNQTT